MTGYEFSADRDRLDAAWVHRMLAEQSYWAAGRPRGVQDAANAGSRCYGIYSTGTGEQVAFARVVTDCATFGWLCDVIVDPAHRGKGLGKQLLSGIVADLQPLELQRTILATDDAHGLYTAFGWASLRNPSNWMERGFTPSG